MDSKKFSHSGKVVAVEHSYIKVAVESQGACAGCQARAKCGMVDSSTRIIGVEVGRDEKYNIGESVNVTISYTMGLFSVVMAYVVPLIILIVSLVVADFLGVDQGVAALVSLAVVALYYVVLYFFRSKLNKQIKFTIEK